MSNYAHLASRLYNTPLMIEAGKGEVIEHVFRGYIEGAPPPVSAEDRAAFERSEERHSQLLQAIPAKRTEAGYLRTENGIAVIPIMGSLVQRAGSLDAMSGLSGYNRIAGQLHAALADQQVRGIVLEIDSPGGESAGVFELASMIREASATKPVFAVANEQAFSAAYLLGSAAQKLFTPAPGMVGSVGVVMYHVDQSAMLDKRGVKVTPIYAGARKVDFSPHAPLSPEALSWATDHVNRTYEMFTQAVADFRDIPIDSVKATEAGLLHADEAAAGGFVDGVASFAETIGMMGEKLSPSFDQVYGVRAAGLNAQSSPEEQHMAGEKGNTSAAPNGAATETTFTQAQVDSARTEARNEGHATGLAAGRVEGSTAERTRIGGILNSEQAKTRMALARHFATNTDMSVEAANAALAVAPSEAAAAPTNALAARMGNVDNPQVGVGTGDATTSTSGASAAPTTVNAANIYEMRAKAAQAAH